MTAFLWNLLTRLTLCGSASMLLLIPLRTALKKRFPACWMRAVSASALLFFLIPFALPLPIPVPQAAQPAPVANVQPTAMSFRPAAPVPIPNTPSPPVDLHSLFLMIWLGGALLYAAFHLANWQRFSRAVKSGSRPTDKAAEGTYSDLAAQMGIQRPPVLCYCTGMGAPMVLGVFRPRILLPEGVRDGEPLEMVLRHELIHYRSGDLPLKCLAMAVCILHWWNPLAHLPSKFLEVDCELACDESLALSMDPGQRKRYGLAILELMTRDGTPLSASFSRQRNFLKRRLEAIMYTKKCPRIIQTACGAALAFLLLCGLLFSSLLAYALPTPEIASLTAGTGMSHTQPLSVAADALPVTPKPSEDKLSGYQHLIPVCEALCETLCNSIEIRDDAFSFTIPTDPLPQGCEWSIHIAGRTPDGMSLHWLENESDNALWQPGKTYRAGINPVPYFANGSPDAQTVEDLCLFEATVLLPDGGESSCYVIPIFQKWAESRYIQLTNEPRDIPFPFSYPVPGAPVTAGFMGYYGHVGTDYGAPSGTDIHAAAAGTVVFVKYDTIAYGYHLILDHGDGLQTLYAHCSELLVQIGDTVARNQVIARVGQTGNAALTHCHFEIRVNGNPVDTIPYMAEALTESSLSSSENAYTAQTLVPRLSAPTKGSSMVGFLAFPGHNGMDFNAPSGDVLAAADGAVTFVGTDDDENTNIVISHGGGVETVYSLCTSPSVKPGDPVVCGQTLAKVNHTEGGTPHLHFEVHINGQPEDPAPYLLIS